MVVANLCMDLYSTVLLSCKSGVICNSTSETCGSADCSIRGGFCAKARARIGLTSRNSTDACFGSRTRICKTEGQNEHVNGVSMASSRDLEAESVVLQCKALCILGRRQHRKTVSITKSRRMHPWFVPLKSTLSAPRLTECRQNTRQSLAANQPNTQQVASLDEMQNEASWRRVEDNDGFKRQRDNNWDTDNDEKMLKLIEGFADFYPIVRAYRNDLCTLEICGCASRSQVLAAMASDESFTAAANLLMGRQLTVLQTLIPGSSGDHSTVSTKLFAPSLLVVECSKKFSKPKGVSAREFLRRLFETVQMLLLSKFYIEFYAPGTVRDMSALEEEEMVECACTIEASNRTALDEIGKAISLYAISCLKENAGGSAYPPIFGKLSNKNRWIPSSGAPVRITALSAKEIQRFAGILSESVHLSESTVLEKRTDHPWCPAPASSIALIRRYLDNASEYWIHEHMPMHKLHIDLSVMKAKVSGGCTISGQVAEVVLTHAQLVDLASALDLYHEDRFTLIDKKLHTGAELELNQVSRSKMAKFLENAAIMSALVGAGIFAWLVAARLKGPLGTPGNTLASNSVVFAGAVLESERSQTNKKGDVRLASQSILPVNAQIPAKEMEALCELVVTTVAKAFAWTGRLQSSVEKGTWIENHKDELNALAERRKTDTLSGTPYVDTADQEDVVLETSEGEETDKVLMLKSAGAEKLQAEDEVQRHNGHHKKELLRYQVVLSRDGNLLGFQPLNREAVSSWAMMPFAEILHKGQKLSPGFWERPLKYEGPPANAVVLELCVLDDPVSPFVSARPFPM